MLLALELDDGCDCGSAIVFLEEGSLKGLAWHAFEVPGLNDALRANDLAEFTVETVFGPVRVDVGEGQSADRADVYPPDGHLVFSPPHPFIKELAVCLCRRHVGTARRGRARH